MKGFAKGSKVPVIGQVQVSWHTNQPSATSAHNPTSSSLEDATTASDKATVGESDAGSSSMMDRETEDGHQETEVGGWGGDDAEDGFGML